MPSFEESLKLLQSSRMPSEETPDDKLKEMEDRLNAQDSTDSLIAAAIPAIAGALTGYGEEGLKYGAQAGMENEKKKSDLQNKLLELRNKRIGTAAKGKLYEVDVDGVGKFATYDQAIGQPVSKKPGSVGQTMEEKIALYAATRGKTAQDYLKRKDQQLNEAESNKTIEQFTKDKDVATATSSYAKLDALEGTLATPGWASGIASQALFIRGVLGEVGNLNEQEQQRAGGSPQLTNASRRLLDKFTKGEVITPTDRQELGKVVSVMRNHYSNLVNRRADNFIKAKKEGSGRDVSPVLEPFRLKPSTPSRNAAPPTQSKDPSKMSDQELDAYLKSKGLL